MTNEELLLTAQHIEQHRHATYLPDPYYLEGLKRDPGDSRINNAYGMLLFRRGNFTEAEKHFRAAIKRLTFRSPNPFNSELITIWDWFCFIRTGRRKPSMHFTRQPGAMNSRKCLFIIWQLLRPEEQIMRKP